MNIIGWIFQTGLQMTVAAVLMACVYALCDVHPVAVATMIGDILLNGGPLLMLGAAAAWCGKRVALALRPNA